MRTIQLNQLIFVTALFSATASFAGSPTLDFDDVIQDFQAKFTAGTIPTAANLKIGSSWSCTFFSAKLHESGSSDFKNAFKFETTLLPNNYRSKTDFANLTLVLKQDTLSGVCRNPELPSCGTRLSFKTHEDGLIVEEILLVDPRLPETIPTGLDIGNYVDKPLTPNYQRFKLSGYYACSTNAPNPIQVASAEQPAATANPAQVASVEQPAAPVNPVVENPAPAPALIQSAEAPVPAPVPAPAEKLPAPTQMNVDTPLHTNLGKLNEVLTPQLQVETPAILPPPPSVAPPTQSDPISQGPETISIEQELPDHAEEARSEPSPESARQPEIVPAPSAAATPAVVVISDSAQPAKQNSAPPAPEHPAPVKKAKAHKDKNNHKSSQPGEKRPQKKNNEGGAPQPKKARPAPPAAAQVAVNPTEDRSSQASAGLGGLIQAIASLQEGYRNEPLDENLSDTEGAFASEIQVRNPVLMPPPSVSPPPLAHSGRHYSAQIEEKLIRIIEQIANAQPDPRKTPPETIEEREEASKPRIIALQSAIQSFQEIIKTGLLPASEFPEHYVTLARAYANLATEYEDHFRFHMQKGNSTEAFKKLEEAIPYYKNAVDFINEHRLNNPEFSEMYEARLNWMKVYQDYKNLFEEVENADLLQNEHNDKTTASKRRIELRKEMLDKFKLVIKKLESARSPILDELRGYCFYRIAGIKVDIYKKSKPSAASEDSFKAILDLYKKARQNFFAVYELSKASDHLCPYFDYKEWENTLQDEEKELQEIHSTKSQK